MHILQVLAINQSLDCRSHIRHFILTGHMQHVRADCLTSRSDDCLWQMCMHLKLHTHIARMPEPE